MDIRVNKVGEALRALLGTNVEWSILGTDVSTIQFYTPGYAAPTQAELDAWLDSH